MLAILNGNVILFFVLDCGMNYSRQESHNRDTVPCSFQMIGKGLLGASTIDSKDTTPHLYSHRATGFEHDGGKVNSQMENYMLLAILNGNVILFFVLDCGMNYSRQESHNRDTVPYSFRMIGEGL